jgi:hypothetical protein
MILYRRSKERKTSVWHSFTAKQTRAALSVLHTIYAVLHCSVKRQENLPKVNSRLPHVRRHSTSVCVSFQPSPFTQNIPYRNATVLTFRVTVKCMRTARTANFIRHRESRRRQKQPRTPFAEQTCTHSQSHVQKPTFQTFQIDMRPPVTTSAADMGTISPIRGIKLKSLFLSCVVSLAPFTAQHTGTSWAGPRLPLMGISIHAWLPASFALMFQRQLERELLPLLTYRPRVMY